MATKSVTGEYTSQAVFTVTESAANTLTFEKLETGLSVYDKIGWVLQRVEWRMGTTNLANFNGTGDYLTVGLTISNQLSALAEDNPAVLMAKRLQRVDYGTAATGAVMSLNWVDDYSTLSGGGLLTLPNPLYCGIVGSGMAAQCGIICRIYFKAIELSDTDYFNLVQARQLLIST